MRAIKTFFLTGLAVVLGAGCFTTADDKSKLTPIPWRTDSVERRYDKPVADVMAATRVALGAMGTITGEEATKKVISARINTRYVTVSSGNRAVGMWRC